MSKCDEGPPPAFIVHMHNGYDFDMKRMENGSYKLWIVRTAKGEIIYRAADPGRVVEDSGVDPYVCTEREIKDYSNYVPPKW